jgi:hypothetical protein
MLLHARSEDPSPDAGKDAAAAAMGRSSLALFTTYFNVVRNA